MHVLLQWHNPINPVNRWQSRSLQLLWKKRVAQPGIWSCNTFFSMLYPHILVFFPQAEYCICSRTCQDWTRLSNATPKQHFIQIIRFMMLIKSGTTRPYFKTLSYGAVGLATEDRTYSTTISPLVLCKQWYTAICKTQLIIVECAHITAWHDLWVWGYAGGTGTEEEDLWVNMRYAHPLPSPWTVMAKHNGKRSLGPLLRRFPCTRCCLVQLSNNSLSLEESGKEILKNNENMNGLARMHLWQIDSMLVV